ncbi:MAG: Type 1 glutamine amidotransferase-like domain-containing protein [Woeseiaceae bacterium]
MTSNAPWRLLLGPQRPVANVGTAIAGTMNADEPIAVISAAWQEAEGDIDDVRKLVPNPLHDLNLYQRADELFANDETLRNAYRTRQDQLIEQQQMYRLRLRHLTIAARGILRAEGNVAAIADERRHAISQLRALDKHHLRQIRKINNRFTEQFNGQQHAALEDNIAEIRQQLAGVNTVLITGGNVVVLLNRLALFDLKPVLEQKNLVAWSAGAMVLCDRIVLFHDRLPQGRRDPEVMCEGLGLISDTVVLPDAGNRIRKNDLIRISLFSRRFSPAACLTLDNGSELLVQHGKVRHCESVRHISRDGRLIEVSAA